jgi:CoA:oxalate CoA-transferase
MENLGLGYEAIKDVNPGLIYAAISGFGHSGPYSRRAAYDMVVQAMGGLMSITGHPDGPPVRVGTSVGDITAALFAVIGILLACAQRRKTGLGQKLDVAMLDTQVAILENAVVRCDLTGEVPRPLGTRHPSITPFQAYPTKDYYIIIAGGNDALFRKMCVAMGLEKCLDDPRFSSNNLRNRNAGALEEFISMVSVTKTTEEWLAVLTEAGVPAAPINTIDKVLTDPQVLARDMINETVYPGLEKALRFAGNPIKLSRTPPLAHKKSPLLGEHGREILSECLDFDEQSIEAYVNGITNNGPVV